VPASLLPCVLAALLGTEPAGGEASSADPSLHLTPIPIVSYGSDIGLQLGGAAYLYQSDHNGERGEWGSLALTYTTRGPRSIELKTELTRLRGTSLSTFLQGKVFLDTSAPYWGEGASLGGLSVPPGAGSPPDPYRYRAYGPWLSAIVRGELAGPLGWWARARYLHLSIENPPPLLVASSPPGVDGGPSSLLHAGLLYDTRDRPFSPRRGVLADASLFGSPPVGALSAHRFGGLDVGARAFLDPWPGAVFAARALYDLKLGDVPFFERSLYEGIGYGEGLGGSGTIRGLARSRLSGEEKMLGSAELRAYLLETYWLGRVQDWGITVGGDVGRARDRGHAAVLGAGIFGGARVLLSHAVVMRLEVGWAGQGGTAFYIAFDEAF
jgi:hypothetical protein